jgi:hypothetical protein
MCRLAFLAALLFPAAAFAGDLTVSLETPGGKPVADAVVMIQPKADPSREPIHFPWPNRMAQQNMKFQPFVLVVPVGAQVSFPNLDLVLHHVYSFSPIKTFELKLYGHDETRLVRFDKPGIVAVGCNIHDGMVGFIRVVDTRYAAKTNAAGEAVIKGVPAGEATVVVWHPYLKSPRNELTQKAASSASPARLAFVGDLRRPPIRGGGY